MKLEFNYKKYAKNAILIEISNTSDENSLENLLLYKKSIELFYNKAIVEVVSSYNSLLVYYESTIEDFYSEFQVLKSLVPEGASDLGFKKRLWQVPVYYATAVAPDLVSFATAKSMTIDRVIALHTTPIYTACFFGFLPGFLYLAGLDAQLDMPRKNTPELALEKGAVAIGGNQTGVYPSKSPGGWHVIGSTPLQFFDRDSEKPCFVSPGDKIQFISISEKEYNDISILVDSKIYHPKSILL